MIEPGKPLPEFALPDADGNTVTPAQFAGKRAVLYFYPKDNTPGCSLEAQQFSGLLEQFSALDCAVYGISKDSPESHCKFRDNKELSVTLLSDQDAELQKALGVWQPKKLFGKEIMGTVRSTVLVGPEGTVERVWPKVKAAGHAEQVLAAVQELSEKKS